MSCWKVGGLSPSSFNLLGRLQRMLEVVRLVLRQMSCVSTLPSVACKMEEYTLPLTLKVNQECWAFVEKQASSETLHNHSFIAVKDTGKTAAKGQLCDIYWLYHTQCDAKWYHLCITPEHGITSTWLVVHATSDWAVLMTIKHAYFAEVYNTDIASMEAKKFTSHTCILICPRTALQQPPYHTSV